MTSATAADPLALRPGEVALLRTAQADLTTHRGFRWPESGPVECSDWRDDGLCGHGLHGLPRGEGNGAVLDWTAGARWIVWAAPADTLRDLGGKSKAPRGRVLLVGDCSAATALICRLHPEARAVVGATVAAGDGGTATAGDRGMATAGNGGTATAGYRGMATAGNGGTATAGDRGMATAGVCGTATAGHRGMATAGDGGILRLRWVDGGRYRDSVGYVGERGIEPGVAYRLDEHGRFKRAEASWPLPL